MKFVITIRPDELAWNTPVSPKTQRAFPLGSATLSPSSPEMAREGFSQTDSTGPDALFVVGLATAPLAAAGEIEAARVAGVTRRAARAKATRAGNRCWRPAPGGLPVLVIVGTSHLLRELVRGATDETPD
jgi:hypothetical protein